MRYKLCFNGYSISQTKDVLQKFQMSDSTAETLNQVFELSA